MASGVVGVGVVVGVCNRSQMRTSKCTYLIFGVSIGLDLGINAQKEFLIGQSSRSHATYRPAIFSLFVCLLFSLYILSRLAFDLIFCMCLGHDRRSHGIEIQGHRSRSEVKRGQGPCVCYTTSIHRGTMSNVRLPRHGCLRPREAQRAMAAVQRE